MNERTRLTVRKPLERLSGLCFMARQSFVLAHEPPDQEQIHAAPHWFER
jgi:hypothetical protein